MDDAREQQAAVRARFPDTPTGELVLFPLSSGPGAAVGPVSSTRWARERRRGRRGGLVIKVCTPYVAAGGEQPSQIFLPTMVGPTSDEDSQNPPDARHDIISSGGLCSALYPSRSYN